ncbi:hypothetical protein [Aurantiacibacter sp. D1-12]|uniref:hypothetical protein n=1 Tax=Aurantiacibacter sp. D1-12 TaxID=2993658 RepID=UPI00237C731A|nr:hypothetical protein [Aurantiacibacter sp. D1-12]MDE1466153.1 hypothetical protein [Aurantiacibacter sp. D1-12]
MSFWTAVVCIVLITSIAGVFSRRNRREDGHALPDSERRMLEQERDDAKQELAELKDRVQVLERIAVDPARRTAEEIENLRDD